MLVAGTCVRVATSFRSDEQTETLLPTGTKGVIQLVDKDGDVCVLFGGSFGNKWVYGGDRE